MDPRRLLCVACIFVLIQLCTAVSQTPSPNDELNTLMLQQHNEVRRKLLQCKIAGQPAAKTMPDLQYDQDIANLAQKWANNCTFGHDDRKHRKTDKFPYVGQNFAAGNSFKRAFDMWFGEYADYNFDENKCTEGKMCGHYTQVVWAETLFLGCAFAECSDVKTFGYPRAIVCNYGPAGNFQGQKPYVKGDQSTCSTTTAAKVTSMKPTTTTTTTTTVKPTGVNPSADPSTTKSTVITTGTTVPPTTTKSTPTSEASTKTTVSNALSTTGADVTKESNTESTDASGVLDACRWIIAGSLICVWRFQMRSVPV